MVDHVLEDVTARVIPIEAPIHVPLRIEGTLFGLAFKTRPIHVLVVAVRWDLPQPAAIGRIAVVMRLDRRDGPHPLRSRQLPDFAYTRTAVHLHADLDDPAGP